MRARPPGESNVYKVAPVEASFAREQKEGSRSANVDGVAVQVNVHVSVNVNVGAQ